MANSGKAHPEWNDGLEYLPGLSDYFAPRTAPFMVNYRVENLASFLTQLRADGCEVDEKSEESEFGKFGSVMEREGNRVELWEPPTG